jgi:hypothetical protein
MNMGEATLDLFLYFGSLVARIQESMRRNLAFIFTLRPSEVQ